MKTAVAVPLKKTDVFLRGTALGRCAFFVHRNKKKAKRQAKDNAVTGEKGDMEAFINQIQVAFDAEDRKIFHVLREGKQAGDGVLRRKAEDRMELELFFISPARHSHGIGLAAWNSIEKVFLETIV